MKSTRLSSQYTIFRRIGSPNWEWREKTRVCKASAIFLCVDDSEHPNMMAPFEKGKTYYAEFLKDYFPHCPNKNARDAWYMHHDDSAFPYVMTTEEIDKFFKRFA